MTEQRLDGKGYRLSITAWAGNLGNHLIQLSGALNVAEQTSSLLTIPAHPLLRRRQYDFSGGGHSRMEEIRSYFFHQSECFQYPILYDSDRRRILQQYAREQLAGRSAAEWARDIGTSLRNEQVKEETLVINIRSGGDIFRADPPPQDDYMQPPLSLYKHVIDSHRYTDCLIITEAARKNPCVDALLAWRPGIRIRTHTGVSGDVRALLAARHLVTCHSSFSWILAMTSGNLRTLHQPASFRVRGVSDLSVYTYSFDNYIQPGEWKATPEQLALMVDHPVSDVRVVRESSRAELSAMR